MAKQATPRKPPPARKNSEVAELKKAQQATDSKVDKLFDAVSGLTDAMTNLAAAGAQVKSQEPDRAPAFIPRHLEMDEQELGGVVGASEFKDTDGQQEMIQQVNGDMANPGFKEKMDNLAFNEQMLRVHIHETSEKDAAKVFEIMVNGEIEFFRRGEIRNIRRKFVEGLARARPVNYENEEYVGQDGKQHVRYPAVTGVRYPFSVVDASPRDQAWLKHIAAQL